MKDKITIGQLAKLLSISTHQVRYFEEKGVLFPELIDENGYRMYGFKQIYRLCHILLLRELDIPVGKIKELFDEGNKEDYVAAMKKSVEDIESKIKTLEALKKKTNSIIKLSETSEIENLKFSIVEIETRNLLEIAKYPIDHVPTALEYYNFIGKVDIYNDRLYEIYDDYYCYTCKETENQVNHVLEKGRYLCYDVILDNVEDGEDKVTEFFDYAAKNKIKLVGKLITIEDDNLSIFNAKTLYIRIQMKIK
ncbi:MerR family transcriptional regulator [Wukongibacter baidiensis]|uniref:helix-turn-helix domain-containing protein n=1 Tax=Wukongibacter baidiensis TaxID=1723361 RepID=UPI003D7FDA16